MTTITLTEPERIHLLALLTVEAQQLETNMQTATMPETVQLQRETYNESREIYHKLTQ